MDDIGCPARQPRHSSCTAVVRDRRRLSLCCRALWLDRIKGSIIIIIIIIIILINVGVGVRVGVGPVEFQLNRTSHERALCCMPSQGMSTIAHRSRNSRWQTGNPSWLKWACFSYSIRLNWQPPTWMAFRRGFWVGASIFDAPQCQVSASRLNGKPLLSKVSRGPTKPTDFRPISVTSVLSRTLKK